MATILPNIINEDCTSLATLSWVQSISGGGSLDASTPGQFHHAVTTTNPSTAIIEKTPTMPTTFTVEISLKLVSNWGTDTSGQSFSIITQCSAGQNAFYFQKDGKLVTYNGNTTTFTTISSSIWTLNTPEIWRFEVTPGSPVGSVNVYRNNVVVQSGYASGDATTGNFFQLALQSTGTANDAYLDYIKVGTGIGTFPTYDGGAFLLNFVS